MIVVTSEEIAGTPRDASGPGWQSRRMIVREHGMGHSVHETRVAKGAELHLHYKNHFETNYCISGEGEVENVSTGEVFPIVPGTIYALNEHDPHILRAKEALLLVCVFTPPLSGSEVHREDGSYAEG
ncbi:ectoine synthase [Shinella yambaruensis]|uniref:L-ectoine synthase n=2 Tax=Shinella TaxID=323620 RepID=A0ABQ5ZMW1_9HYPH|nr:MULTISPECIES: ectoine synthase [Shinella]CAI0334702.1 L-ectoine synthase [Rhizobiaceae bacterium]CAK7260130.1 L-ectoine synthase [Shinella sp. WSC3-e]MCJ8029648.1 ectoine synthase [Shinella yambaruensis]MCO5139632.1 ectoine synthase [Shinella sp.]MCU7983924.1 ectoine synthase [Shinella yambaruensis]